MTRRLRFLAMLAAVTLCCPVLLLPADAVHAYDPSVTYRTDDGSEESSFTINGYAGNYQWLEKDLTIPPGGMAHASEAVVSILMQMPVCSGGAYVAILVNSWQLSGGSIGSCTFPSAYTWFTFEVPHAEAVFHEGVNQIFVGMFLSYSSTVAHLYIGKDMSTSTGDTTLGGIWNSHPAAIFFTLYAGRPTACAGQTNDGGLSTPLAGTVVHFDGSCSTDVHTPVTGLSFRWTTDSGSSGWSNSPSYDATFDEGGHTAYLDVMDGDGFVDTTQITFSTLMPIAPPPSDVEGLVRHVGVGDPVEIRT